MESLTLEQAYYIAEIVGVLSIVMSLVYVALQIRQNTMAIRSDTAQAVHETWGNIYERMSTNSQLMQVILKGNSGTDDMSEIETAQYLSYWMQSMLIMQNAYYQFTTGSLEPKVWHSMEKTLIGAIAASPGFREFWAARKTILDNEFREYVDGDLSTRPPIEGFKIFGVREPISSIHE